MAGCVLRVSSGPEFFVRLSPSHSGHPSKLVGYTEFRVMLLLPFSLTIRWYSCHPLFLTYSVRRNLQRQSGSFVYLFCVHTQSR